MIHSEKLETEGRELGDADRASATRGGLSTFHRAEVRVLLARARAIEVRDFEAASPVVLLGELRPRTLDVLDAAGILLGRLLEDCEPTTFGDEPPSGGFAIATEDAAGPYEAGVADLAFIAQIEIRNRAERLLRLTTGNGALVAECDGSLRRVTRALVAVDRALGRELDEHGTAEAHPDLELSLRIHRAYALFRRRTVALGGGTDPIRRRLLEAAREIAVLVGLPFYGQLRLADRMHLRALQQRLMVCLRVDPFEELDAYRLWSDVMSFASMLAQVNHRQELFEHDSSIVIRVVDSLSALSTLSEASARELSRIEGRDDELDALLASGRRDLASWAPVLTALANELGRRSGARP